MRPGFLNTSAEAPTIESLKGMKKKELKARCLQYAEREASARKEAQELRKQRDEGVKSHAISQEKYIGALRQAKIESTHSLYIQNIDTIVKLYAEICKGVLQWKMSFDDTKIVVTFNPTSDGTKYGVWMCDTGSNQRFKICPWYGSAHTHLAGVPCGGAEVQGADEVISTLKNFAQRENEFAEGAKIHDETNKIMETLREFLSGGKVQ
jgi:hypothetical protein